MAGSHGLGFVEKRTKDPSRSDVSITLLAMTTQQNGELTKRLPPPRNPLIARLQSSLSRLVTRNST